MFYFFFFIHPITEFTDKININNFESYRQYKKRVSKNKRVSHREFLRIRIDMRKGTSNHCTMLTL